MGKSVAYKLIESHLVTGEMIPGQEIGLKIDQTLTQDATGTLVMLEYEAMGLTKVNTEVSVQYVDHNLIQADFKNPDDHLFLLSACKKFGVWYSRAGNGVSHPVHMEHFGKPGKTLLGSDSHTCAGGSMGMLAIGAGGIEVAMAMAGKPFFVKMPTIWGIKLLGELPPWVSAKDIILELLRRYSVKAGVEKIIEYYGSGLAKLSAMDRHVIANMGAELGATASVFPSDNVTHQFLRQQQREQDWLEIVADPDAHYDEITEINLAELEPLIALPSSPDKVVTVREVAGKPIYQAMIGSSANPGLRDFAIAALIVEGKQTHSNVSFDINPTSRQILENLIQLGYWQKLVRAGGRTHQAGCNGCIGMGQAPATGRISLRTVPRNFPGRSGTKEDQVYLCSPETAAASALTGVITDPRTLGITYPQFNEPETIIINREMLLAPATEDQQTPLAIGPNIKPLPTFPALSNEIQGPVLLKVGDNISTDIILPAGTKVLPYRSNIPGISQFVFTQIDETYPSRALTYQQAGSLIVAGANYGQGSSREHAAIAPRYLGVRAVLAKSFARIHFQNLINFGILPLVFVNADDWQKIAQYDELRMLDILSAIKTHQTFQLTNITKNENYEVIHFMSDRQIEIVIAGGLINTVNQGKI